MHNSDLGAPDPSSSHTPITSPPTSASSSSNQTPSASSSKSEHDRRGSKSSSFSLSSAVLKSASMLKFWPSTPIDQLTPRATANGHERNPFDALAPEVSAKPKPISTSASSTSAANAGTQPTGGTPRSPSGFFQAHHLLNSRNRSSSVASNASNGGDITPLAVNCAPPVLSHAQTDFASAITKSMNLPLNLHVPKMSSPAPSSGKSSNNDLAAASQTQATTSLNNAHLRPMGAPPSVAASPSSSSASSGSSSVSRGQLHVKLIQARNLHVRSLHARPYIVVQFEQNEFVSREPIHELEKEARGVATSLNTHSRTPSSTAISALGAINSRAIEHAKRSAVNSANTSPQSSVSSGRSTLAPSIANGNGHVNGSANGGGLFGGLSAHNPVWKHEVSL